MGVGAERRALRRVRLAQDAAGLAGEGDHLARLHALQPGGGAEIEALMLRDQVQHLAADHAVPAGRLGQRRHQLAADVGVLVGRRIGQHLEGEGQQPVAGQDGGRLVELAVAGRTAAPQFAIVHRRQIVVDQRIAVDHLDGRGDADGAVPVDAEKGGRLHHQEGAQPLAAVQAAIAHGVEHPRFGQVGGRQQRVDLDLDRLGDVGQRGFEFGLGNGLHVSRSGRVRCRGSRRRSR